MYKILVKKSAEKELSKLPDSAIKKVSVAIDLLASNPRPNGSKKLTARDPMGEFEQVTIGLIYSIEDVLKILEIRRIAIEGTSIVNY